MVGSGPRSLQAKTGGFRTHRQSPSAAEAESSRRGQQREDVRAQFHSTKPCTQASLLFNYVNGQMSGADRKSYGSGGGERVVSRKGEGAD